MNPEDLNANFTNSEVIDRILACSLAGLAAHLAAQAGEAVTRPLTSAQLARAFLVNSEELQKVRELLHADWTQRHEAGLLPKMAY